MQSGRRRIQSQIFAKRKRFRENWTSEYTFKRRTGDEDQRNKYWYENHETDPRRLETCLICAEGKSEEKDARTTISSLERLNIANNPLLLILTSLVTETPVESNVAAEELKEYYLLEKLQFPSRGTQCLPNLQTKKQKKLKTKGKYKTRNKANLELIQNQEQSLPENQQDELKIEGRTK